MTIERTLAGVLSSDRRDADQLIMPPTVLLPAHMA